MFVREHYLHCDLCGECFNTDDRGMEPFHTLPKIRQRAKKEGWTRTKIKEFGENVPASLLDRCDLCNEAQKKP